MKSPAALIYWSYMSEERPTTPPGPTGGDTLHTIARAGISLIPFVGGAAKELFTAVIGPPLTRRRDEWLQSIAEGLKALEAKVEGFRLESLGTNDVFVTATMQASQIAIRNHDRKKLDALRNAVLNAALVPPPEEEALAVLLNFIDIATSWHLKVLEFYCSPQSYLNEYGIKLYTGDRFSSYVSTVFPELREHEAFRLQIERDLLHYGLVFHEGEWYSRRITATGERVLALTRSPL